MTALRSSAIVLALWMTASSPAAASDVGASEIRCFQHGRLIYSDRTRAPQRQAEDLWIGDDLMLAVGTAFCIVRPADRHEQILSAPAGPNVGSDARIED